MFRCNMSFNQKQYIGNYNKSTYKMFPFRVRKDDTKTMNKLISVPSINGYLNSLIEKDINNKVLTIKQIKERMLPIIKKHNINEVYLFGSYARGEANNNSDIDIYCDVGDIKTFIDQGKFEEELEEALGKKVDVIFIGSSSDEFFKRQLDYDKIKIY
ncbi:MAG: nucleotidyltransferase domain-containing protein [Erysipelotrichaceae bacterium]|nr:nucleotidyltransferase domain-containing protein [Erysipelotrichaceae bacterium]